MSAKAVTHLRSNTDASATGCILRNTARRGKTQTKANKAKFPQPHLVCQATQQEVLRPRFGLPFDGRLNNGKSLNTNLNALLGKRVQSRGKCERARDSRSRETEREIAKVTTAVKGEQWRTDTDKESSNSLLSPSRLTTQTRRP